MFVYAIVFMAFAIKNEGKKFDAIGQAPTQPGTISVTGSGKVVGTPDIATVDLGFTSQMPDVQAAIGDNTTKMNNLVAALKNAGIAAADIQTTRYNIYPNYDYSKPKQGIIGYTAEQGVMVKIRDLAKISNVLQVAGNIGANQVSGLSFTIEKPEALKDAAREQAIKAAMNRARALSAQLGVSLVKIVNFNESSSYPQPFLYSKDSMGMGGGISAAPSIEAGSLDISSDVSLVFEIR